MTQPPQDNEAVADFALSVNEVAVRLGLEQPLGDADEAIISNAIADAQADVEGYLGRPITPETFTEHDVWPQDAWPGYRLRESKVVAVISATPDLDTGGLPTGRWTVVYRAGLDAANDRQYAPIKRYLVAAVLNDAQVIRVWQKAQGTQATRRISNVSVEGQSVSYEYLTPTGVDTSVQGARYAAARNAGGTGTPGALNLDTLDRWRLRGRRTFQRRNFPADPFVLSTRY